MQSFKKSVLISTIILLLSLINLCSFSQSLDFFSEDLVFKLNNGSLTVEGEYHFRNLKDICIERTLSYPFPQDDDHGMVTWFSAWPKDEPDSSVVIHKRKDGGNFYAKFQPLAERTYFIGYTQELKAGHARYILLTTQQWKKAFDHATYKLWVPLNIKVDSISYIPDKIDTVKDHFIFKWTKTNFMPDRDFEVWFQ